MTKKSLCLSRKPNTQICKDRSETDYAENSSAEYLAPYVAEIMTQDINLNYKTHSTPSTISHTINTCTHTCTPSGHSKSKSIFSGHKKKDPRHRVSSWAVYPIFIKPTHYSCLLPGCSTAPQVVKQVMGVRKVTWRSFGRAGPNESIKIKVISISKLDLLSLEQPEKTTDKEVFCELCIKKHCQLFRVALYFFSFWTHKKLN